MYDGLHGDMTLTVSYIVDVLITFALMTVIGENNRVLTRFG